MKIQAFARLLASVTALTLAAPALAQNNGAQDNGAPGNGSVTDFELPTEQATPRAQVQGPVVEGIAPPRAARPSPTPAPTPSRPAQAAPVTVDPGPSTPAPRAASDEVRTAIDGFGTSSSRPQAAATASPAATAATPDEAAATEADPSPVATARPGLSLPQQTPAAQPSAAAPTPEAAPSGGIAWWTWLLALLAVGAVGLGAGWFWRDRRAAAPLLIEAIERPQVPEPLPEPSGPPAALPKVATRRQPEPQPQPAPEPAMAEDDHDEDASERPLRIALEPARLSVSLLNATLAYRILLTNQGDTPLRDISIDGDMISAHASLSEEEQVAASGSALENRHLIRTLFPGETKVVSGEFALPLPMIRPIRNGDAALFVPLARLRVVSGGDHADVLVQTSVVGQRSVQPGGGLRPFRLDLGPRVYSELAQRAFA